MPIHSQWDNPEKTIILTTHSAEWMWDELHEHDATVVASLLESVDHAVSIIIDMRRCAWLPLEDFAGQVKKTTNTHRFHKIDVVVFVLKEAGIGALLKTAHKRYGESAPRYLDARTIEEAREIIIEERSRQYTRLQGELQQP
jgi:hypothetical protein